MFIYELLCFANLYAGVQCEQQELHAAARAAGAAAEAAAAAAAAAAAEAEAARDNMVAHWGFMGMGSGLLCSWNRYAYVSIYIYIHI